MAVNLAVSLMLSGKRVGLLDVNIHGHGIPKMLCLEDARISVRDEVMLPAAANGWRLK